MEGGASWERLSWELHELAERVEGLEREVHGTFSTLGKRPGLRERLHTLETDAASAELASQVLARARLIRWTRTERLLALLGALILVGSFALNALALLASS